MGVQSSIKISGIGKLQRKLAALTVKQQKRAIAAALKAAGQPGARAARKAAPKRKSGKTPEGRKPLKRSISVRKIAKLQGKEIGAVTIKASRPHAHLVNSGTAQRQTKAGENRGRVTASHFMEAGVAATKAQGPAIFAAKMEAAILKAAKG